MRARVQSEPLAPTASAGHVAVTAAADPTIPVSCGYSADTVWTTASTAPSIVGSCSLTVPRTSGIVIIATGTAVQRIADGSVVPNNGPYEAHFAIAVDDLGPDVDTDRVVTVDGYDLDVNHPVSRTFTLSGGAVLSPGTHTISLVGHLEPFSGSRVIVIDPSIVAISIPLDSPTSGACWSAGPEPGSVNPVTTASASFVTARSCTIEAPVDGFALVVGSGSLSRVPGDAGQPYEARVRLSEGPSPPILEHRAAVDDAPTLPFTHSSVGLATIVPVVAGTHTFDLGVARAGGSATVVLDDPSVAVISFPSDSPAITRCAAVVSGVATITAQAHDAGWQPVGACTLETPYPATLVVAATNTMTVDNGVGYAQARFRIGLDSSTGDAGTDRWVDSFQDASPNGFDQSVAVSLVTPLAVGAHTVSLLGARSAGNGIPVVGERSIVALGDRPRRSPRGTVGRDGVARVGIGRSLVDAARRQRRIPDHGISGDSFADRCHRDRRSLHDLGDRGAPARWRSHVHRRGRERRGPGSGVVIVAIESAEAGTGGPRADPARGDGLLDGRRGRCRLRVRSVSRRWRRVAGPRSRPRCGIGVADGRRRRAHRLGRWLLGARLRRSGVSLRRRVGLWRYLARAAPVRRDRCEPLGDGPAGRLLGVHEPWPSIPVRQHRHVR